LPAAQVVTRLLKISSFEMTDPLRCHSERQTV
jgi:hypothetical protein